jgi:hypothetical protein
MKNGIAQITTGQFAEFAGSVVACLPRQGFNAQYYIEHPSALRALLKEAFVPKPVIGWWQNFYQKYFELNLDFSEVIIPDYQLGFDWIIIIPMGLTIQQVLKVIKKKMKVCPYKDVLSDRDMVSNDRDAKNGHYAVRFRKRIEADEETKNLSANDLANQKIAGCTLLERLVMILMHFEATGEQLDLNNVTLCSGSRGAGGGVPRVYWNSDVFELNVRWYTVGFSGSSLRARVAVSC